MPRASVSLPADLCPCCQGKTCPHISAPDINKKVSGIVFHVRRCMTCDMMYVVNSPPDLESYYSADYHALPRNRAELNDHLPAQRFKIDLLRRFKAAGRLLEIGPSIGVFCALAQEAGFSVDAIERNRGCVRFLSEEVGVRVIHSADPAAVLADNGHYDAICLWHSLEHLPEPWVVLKQAAACLAPGGILVIAVPNPLSPQARLMGAGWPHYDLPRHLYHLPLSWLQLQGRRLGLEWLFVTTRDAGSLGCSRGAWGMKARNLAPTSRLGHLLCKLGLAFGTMMSFWEGREGHGAAYTAVLRRSFSVGEGSDRS